MSIEALNTMKFGLIPSIFHGRCLWHARSETMDEPGVEFAFDGPAIGGREVGSPERFRLDAKSPEVPVLAEAQDVVQREDLDVVDISDAACILNWLFLGGKTPLCVAATNSNGDETPGISDATYLLNHLFLGGPALAPPFPDCGPSQLPADEVLGCDTLSKDRGPNRAAERNP